MASNCSFLVPLALLFLLSVVPVKGDDALIEKICGTIYYRDLCISMLKSNISSMKADVKGLATIMVEFGVTNSSATYSYLKAQLHDEDTKAAFKKNLQYCSTRYSHATRYLRVALHKLSNEEYHRAQTKVAVAGDVPADCEDEFTKSPGLGYPSELSRRGNDLEQICYIARRIIDHLIPDDS
ncbi:hypothetical protein Nepgr_017656 [Nepenthes gracilis]|uniref:Pectinesterase inhibitor domain-containing protein n=1 Tax=Nepenthes gracilis TaxID=150966 RepID=A0AAD3SPS1_NEPGR|nr:hypothetical protein Nepgr_017656 [Nepenthes gracilis]